MPRHLFLPKQSLKDVRILLLLGDNQLRDLEKLLGTSESLSPRDSSFVEKVAATLELDAQSAASVALVGQFLLSVVEEGHTPDEIISDVREFVSQNAEDSANESLGATVDSKREILVSMLTPKPDRARALKVRYLKSIHQTVDSFRSVCELRPLFERTDDEGVEEIVGYVPTVLLHVKQSDADGEESQIVLNLSSAMLKKLGEVVERTEAKLRAIRKRFGDQLLGDTTQEI